MTTCYHLVDTLIARGYLVRVGHGQLRVGTALMGLSNEFVEQARPVALLSPVVVDLLERSRERVFLAIWDGEDVILRLCQEGPPHLTGSGFIRVSGYAHARCSGKAILAFLPREELDRYFATHDLVARTPRSITDEVELRRQLFEIRERGWASETEEFTVGICSLGAPFFGADGRVLGALSLALPAARYEEAVCRPGLSISDR
jgi:DNA-binding IclR family transcriptional regulator